MSCAIEIKSFQNFSEVLKTCSACRKSLFDKLSTRGRCAAAAPGAFSGAMKGARLFAFSAPAHTAVPPEKAEAGIMAEITLRT